MSGAGLLAVVEALLIGGLAAAFLAVIAIPFTAEIYGIDWPEPAVVGLALAITVGCLVVLDVVLRVRERVTHADPPA